MAARVALCDAGKAVAKRLAVAQLAPGELIGTNLVEACKQYEAEMPKGQPEIGMDSAKSNTPLLGYTVSYAISNVLLTFMGPVVVFTA